MLEECLEGEENHVGNGPSVVCVNVGCDDDHDTSDGDLQMQMIHVFSHEVVIRYLYEKQNYSKHLDAIF
jgi:hypothetical protein